REVRVTHLAVADPIAGLERRGFDPQDDGDPRPGVLRVDGHPPGKGTRAALDGLARTADGEADRALRRIDGEPHEADRPGVRQESRRREKRRGRHRGRHDERQAPQDVSARRSHPRPPGRKRRFAAIASAYSGRAMSALSSVRTRWARINAKRMAEKPTVIDAPPASGTAMISPMTAT